MLARAYLLLGQAQSCINDFTVDPEGAMVVAVRLADQAAELIEAVRKTLSPAASVSQQTDSTPSGETVLAESSSPAK